MLIRNMKPCLEALPHALILISVVGVPIATLATISFRETDGQMLHPAFSLENHREILTSQPTLALYPETIKHSLPALIISMVIGFTCSYFLVFLVKSLPDDENFCLSC